MKRSVVLMLAALIALLPMSAPADALGQELTVSAAVSLKSVFEELGKVYEEQHKGEHIRFNFGASGALAEQIKGGATADVFASAALKDMDGLEKAGLIVEGTRRNFASNRVVLIVPVSSALPIDSFEGLGSAAITRICLGNPATMPAGRYADQVMVHYGLNGAVRGKTVFGENVRQVLEYVARGEVDAGVVYATDARARTGEVRIAATAPAGSHKPIVYPAAVVKGAGNAQGAAAFIRLIVSSDGRRILSHHGFLSPPQ